ncbi:MAG: hypothetical protein KDB53_10410, partial [Planctomycetes bacterium]|nr:hypothetical protein [Planctomycetota bacterium]
MSDFACRLAAALIMVSTAVLAQAPGEDVPIDTLQLNDGRFFEGKRMTRTPDGIVIHFENGDVLVDRLLVKDSLTSKVEGVEVEISPEDQLKIDDGLVRFEGKWMRPAQRDGMLKSRQAARQSRLEEARTHRLWRNRYTKETKNFAFEYTIDPEKMDEYAELMENYYTTFTREWRIRKPSDMGRLRVCFYHDAEYYHQVSGASPGVIGYFRFVPPEELHFYFDRLDERMTIDVMFHEANHYLTHLIDPKFVYPPWVNESLAEYYGSSQWDPVTKKMSSGHLQAGRLTVIKDQIAAGDWQALEPLIRLEHGAFNAVHYAWGWSFVHFLLESKKYSTNFKRFYVALARERSIKRVPWNFNMRTVEPADQIEALKKYLKVKDLMDLEKEWHDYVNGLEQKDPRGYSEAGEQVLGRGMPIKARRYFQTAIDSGFKTPMTYYGLGRALEQKA